MKHICLTLLFVMFGCMSMYGQSLGKTVKWDSRSLWFDGKRVVPVMGEIHYSRIPENEWRQELQKMKAGGVTMIANYVFWNHVEEKEGVFDWSKQRSLRHFLELCKDENLPVVLRIGPFCHGEVRCGGIPDWILEKNVELRSEAPGFLHYVKLFYRQIFSQVQGLLWKDKGPVVACQFDNEYGGEGSYLMALKHIAQEIGFDLPFYTRTGWPELKTPVPYGEMIPLYGDYADGFWERSIKETAGDYWKAFNFKPFRSSSAIASEQLKEGNGRITKGDELYPYFTCELGGGMMTSYHRRVYVYPQDAYSLAIVKLGSGSNLLGYYMYHGGTNPDGFTYLNEMQRTPYTNWNDLPVKTYDFQAPLGEFGQKNPHYYILRKLHLFMHDYGETLAPMDAFFPQADKPQIKGIDSYLRWSYRQKDNSAFVFVNNYERLQNITDKKGIQFDVCGVKFPQKKMTVPAGTCCIFPVNIDGIRYATAQIVARRNGKIFLEQIEGIPTEISVDGKVMRNVKAKGIKQPIYKNVYLLTSAEAENLFLPEEERCRVQSSVPVLFHKSQDAGPLRKITIGVAGVAEEPVDADFEQAAIYKIDVPSEKGLLSIKYHGDCARLYANGRLLADNFYNGREFLYGLWRLPQGVKQLELRILPMQSNEPVYFPCEADTTPGENVISCELYE
ncbi:beta-galactosidase [Phocaeicola plebeius]|uniref:beta-galactosidase n=1 Tax=Phocaeicola plebeius TaxID=310297 RepID=UPI0026ECD2AE|nr:beta-galactosidase [Phocaeicola plebeius]